MDGLQQALARARIKQDAIAQARADNADLCIIPELDLVLVRNVATGEYESRCMKCLAAELVAEGAPRPNYSFQFTNPDITMVWDVGRAWKMVQASGRKPMEMDHQWLRRWIANRSNLTPDHLDHIPPDHLNDPLLVGMLHTGRDNEGRSGPLVPFPVLVDGHHRAARAIRDCRPVSGFLLTAEEQMEVVTRLDGHYDAEAMGWRARDQVR
jgi:hypothetical protein